jgi:hypothetical protein
MRLAVCPHSQHRARGDWQPAGRHEERILIRYRGLSAVRTAVSAGRCRASGAKGCVLTAPPLQVRGHDAIGILRASGHRNLAAALGRNARDATQLLPLLGVTGP